jgi:hypothetical protein
MYTGDVITCVATTIESLAKAPGIVWHVKVFFRIHTTQELLVPFLFIGGEISISGYIF